MDTIASLKSHDCTNSILNHEKILELHPKAMSGDGEAMDMIVKSLTGWMIKVSYNIYSTCRNGRHGIELDDMVQEGLMGLMEGIQKFDPSRGCRITTYCKWHIRKACLNYCYDSGLVRVSRYILCDRKQADRRCGPPFSPVLGLEGLSIGLDGTKDIDEEMDSKEIWKRVQITDVLTNREKGIIYTRFFEEKTYLTIGERWGVSRERVRQILNQSIEKLRKEFKTNDN